MASTWLQCLRPKPRARVRLVAFPFAGAGAFVYRTWEDLLDDQVELWSVQLPGRETRVREQPLRTLEPLVASLDEAIRPLDTPTAFFGHSFGALLAFDLARHMTKAGRGPAMLFASGRRAPQCASRFPPIHDLPPRQFLAKIQERYNTVPAALLEEPELLDLLLPALQADFSITERYQYVLDGPPPLTVPVMAFGGLADAFVDGEELAAWSRMTSGAFSSMTFAGGHFFLNDPPHREQMVKSMCLALRHVV